jgi:2-succinyl-6-hydroxy-2,4-cyclohexadiene-1-carboxylate synthase
MFEFSRLTRGDPRHPPLIFLHGFLGAKEDWEEMFPYFEKHFFCIALDLPGHGSTPYCDQMISELKTAIPSRAVIIGYSLGGRIALQLQEHTSVIIALSAHPGLATLEEKKERREVDDAWCEKLLNLPFNAFLIEWYAQPIFQTLARNPPLLQKIIARRMEQSPRDLVYVMQQMSLSHQMLITQFLCPTLLLYGDEDLKYRQLYCSFVNTEAVSVRGIARCGHAIHLEDASCCAQEIMNWLEKTYAHI